MTSVVKEGEATYAALRDIRPHNAGLLRTITAVDAYVGTTNSDGPHAVPTLDGAGTLHARLGYTFSGGLKDGEPCGRGVLKWRDGRTVVGVFAHGTVDGSGTLRWPNGDVYTGAMRRSVRHGVGCLLSDGGAATYDGEWADGTRHGSGVQHYANGSVYSGQWANNARHGRGTLRYSTGDVYEGEWESDVPCGHGVMGWTDASKTFYRELYTGEWRGGQPEGAGQSTYVALPKHSLLPASGAGAGGGVGGEASTEEPQLPVPSMFIAPAEARLNVYVGAYRGGQRDGAGTFFYADGSCYQGWWTAGAKSGVGSFTSAVGEMREEHHGSHGDATTAAAVGDVLGGEVDAEEGNALAVVPTVSSHGLGSLLESEEDLCLTLHNLLYRYNTTLKVLFQHSCRLRENVALPSTQRDWWQQRLPGRVTLVQCLALLHNAGILGGDFAIGDALRTAADVVRIETASLWTSQTLRHSTSALPMPTSLSSSVDEIHRADGTLNHRQFCEWIIRVAARVQTGPDTLTVSAKLRALLEESLSASTTAPPPPQPTRAVAAVFLPHSLHHASEVLRHRSALMHAYKELQGVGEVRNGTVALRTFLTAVRRVLERHRVAPSDVVASLAWLQDDGDVTTHTTATTTTTLTVAAEQTLTLSEELREVAMAKNKSAQQSDADTEATQSFVEFVETVMTMADLVHQSDGTELDALLDEIQSGLFAE